MDTRTAEKKKHNAKHYRTFIYRVRRNTELERRLLAFAQEGDTSVNQLMTNALCKMLDCPLPNRMYVSYKRTRLM